MKKAVLKLPNRRRIATISIVMILFLQILVVPTASNSDTLRTNYSTAKELDNFFKNVNQRNDETNETLVLADGLANIIAIE